MGVYYFNEDFDISTMGGVLQLLDMVEGDELVLYLTSAGGQYPAAQVLVDFLSRRFEKIYVMCSGFVASSAWRMIMLLPNAELFALEGTYGVDHMATMFSEIQVRQSGTKLDQLETFKTAIEDIDEPWVQHCTEVLGYTDEELEILTSGGDVHFTPYRFREIIETKESHYKLIEDGII